MTDLPRPTEIDRAVAFEWLRQSLSQGNVISRSVLTAVQESDGRSQVLIPEAVDAARLTKLSEGGVIGTHSAQEALPPVLDELKEDGAASVVVEDEVRLRSDPNTDVDGLLLTAFVDDSVLHWADFGDGAEPAVQVLHRGSHGYPLNAFIVSATTKELGLVNGADLDSNIGDAIAQALIAVIVAAYDAETFLIWKPR